MGKNLTSFAKNTVAEVSVEVTNASKADVSAKKKESKVYVTYTGYRGGLNEETLGHLIDRRGMKDAIERAVYRMLPDNKLRDPRFKNLTITE